MNNSNYLLSPLLPRLAETSVRKTLHSQPALRALLLAASLLAPAARATLPAHDVSAALIRVTEIDTTQTGVSFNLPVSIHDFALRPTANRGDYDCQIGPESTNDLDGGILITCIANNGRDNAVTGTNTYGSAGIDYVKTSGDPNFGAYWVAVFSAPGTGAGTGGDYNFDAGAAWFPYTTWLGGLAHNSTAANGGTNDVLTGSPSLILGTHFVGISAGRSLVDLTSLGIDSRTDGILLVTGGKNEANYALSQVNSNNGTWTVYCKDNSTATANGYEQDPVAFVYVPRTNTTVVSGRFLGNATIDMWSGATPQFTVANTGTGTYELKITGRSPKDGVLIISPEGGLPINMDNLVSYETNSTGDGWEIQSRDTPSNVLESPGATEPVVSFVFVPGPTPGFTVTPTNNLATSEAGGTATFTVTLDTPPTDDVTIAVSSSDTTEGTVSPSSLTFTTNDWNVPQTITITGVDDALTDGSQPYTIILAPAVSTDSNYNGRDPSDVAVINTDNEGGITVAPTSGLTTTEAGGTDSFTVVLNTMPAADVTIGLSSGDLTEGTVAPSSLTFTPLNWNIAQTVTVTGVDDASDDGDVAYSIITAASVSTDPTYNGLNPADVAVLNIDNDTTGVTITPNFGLYEVEGRTTNYAVVLNTQPASDVTINVSSSDTAQGGAVSPSSLTFTPANWNISQIVTITGANDLVPDASTVFLVTNRVSSSDTLYAGLAPMVLTVTTLDDEAVLTLPSGDLIYGIGQPPLGVDGRASIVDTNTANYNSATLTVTLTANGTADDRLEIRNTGTGTGQIGVSGGSVSYGGTPIATFTGGIGTTPLAVTFNASATPTAAEALLRSVTFRNVNSTPSLNRRSVSVVLAHGDGGTSSATSGIRVGLLHFSDFQEAADHGYGPYTGEADIQLQQTAADTAFPAGGASGLFIDWPDNNNALHVLLRFDNIFGDGFGQVPTNAVIVAADLYLHVNDSGDGSPLNRMLMDWDATNATWNSVGGGLLPDDFRARTAFDSQWSTASANGATTTGTISFSVRPDIIAWLSGETNFGWVMTGWPNNTDGTGFSPGEAPNVSDRPRLRVLWLPAGTAMASFRQGVNGYASEFDTRLRQNAPDTDFSAVTTVFSDGAVSGASDPEHVLIRFDDIIGAGPGQVPPGSQVHAAMLDLASVTADAMGDGGRFYTLLQSWQDTTSTWNSWVDGIQPDGVEAATTPSAVAGSPTLNPDVQGGFNSFEMTTDVQAWVNGTPNYGWAILPWPGGNNGWGISTAESADETARPQLRIFFTPSAANNIMLLPLTLNPSTVQVRFTGTAGNTYSIQRVGALGATWSTIGTAQVGQDGTGTFTDNAPLAGTAFYRISYP